MKRDLTNCEILSYKYGFHTLHFKLHTSELSATLPDHVKRSARRNYKIWKNDASHPGLQFKKIGGKREIYSIRVGIGWRALGVKDEQRHGLVLDWIPRRLRKAHQQEVVAAKALSAFLLRLISRADPAKRPVTPWVTRPKDGLKSLVM